MVKETEIKLRVSRETLNALRDHPLLKKGNKNGWTQHELFNQYFDTENHDLAQAKVALRLRRDGEQIIQTLKTRGQSVAGLSERNEWDWPLSKAQLDLEKLDGQCWPASLAELDKKQLTPIFSTDFVRQRADLAWGRGKAKVQIEVALDLGTVVAGEGQEEICELELELRQGEPSALLELASELAQELALMPCDISKAERGYRLFNANSYSLAQSLPALQAEQTLDDAFSSLAWYLLGNSQRLAEQYRFNGHWRLLGDWLEQLVELRGLLGSLGQAAPRASSQSLRQILDAVIEHWRPQLLAGQHDETLRQQAPQLFAAELDNPRWGQLSLGLARWLLNRSWTLERNNRGNRQGGAALLNWLNTLLSDEANALQLPRYRQQPYDLAEQLPRLDRLLAWLHLARNVLELEGSDRLYGELNKLRELALEPGEELNLAARQQQILALVSLKPWKLLLAKQPGK